jgi:multimeric flavodoxin WrbA
MERGSLKRRAEGGESRKGKPIKILGISSSYRSKYECAKEDPISLQLLKITLAEAKKAGAEIELIDLRELNIGPCKECYSTCPAQCRFNEKLNMCDCYPRKGPAVFLDDGKQLSLKEAYEELSEEEFLKRIQDKGVYDLGDDMWKVYKAMREADGIIFAGFTNYYSRPVLMQLMFSRLCALDGGVEKLWGDGKNLGNSILYAKNPKSTYEQRLYGKFAAFINVSKEGDSVTPNMMKACVMMGMKTIPLGVCYRVNWYNEPTHRPDMKNSLKDKYTLGLARNMGKKIVEEVKRSDRNYGLDSQTV